jgi:hypothetical protein
MLRVGKCKLQALAAAATLAAPLISLAQTSGTWQNSVNGDWNITDNWNGVTFPSGGGAAVLPNPVTNVSITLPAGFGTTLSNINFQANGVLGYSLIGDGSIMIGTTSSGSGTIDVASGGTGTITAQLGTQTNGNLFKTGDGGLIIGANNAFGTATGLQINGGALQVNASTALTNVAAITTGGSGQFILNNASVTGATFAGLGSNPTDGAIRSLAGNNTWNGSWFVVAPTSVGVDAGTLTLTGVVFDSAQSAANGFTKVGGGTLVGTQFALNGAMNVSVGTVKLQPNIATASRVGALTIAGDSTPTATLNLSNGALVIDNPTFAAAQATHTLVNAQVRYANHDFAWDRPGITSNNAATDIGNSIPTSIGILLNNDGGGNPLFYGDGTSLPKFRNQSVNSNTVLMRYTYLGDSDLGGTVDSLDFTLFQLGFTNSSPYVGWAWGDYDYSGVVDSVDFTLFQFGFAAQGPALGDPLLASVVDFAGAHNLALIPELTAVPEPATIGLLGMSTLGLLARRRRRH